MAKTRSKVKAVNEDEAWATWMDEALHWRQRPVRVTGRRYMCSDCATDAPDKVVHLVKAGLPGECRCGKLTFSYLHCINGWDGGQPCQMDRRIWRRKPREPQHDEED